MSLKPSKSCDKHNWHGQMPCLYCISEKHMNNQDDRDTLINKMVLAFEQFGDEYDINQAMQASADVMESHIKQKIRTATLDEVRPEVERLLTDETVIANCINLETLNKAIDNLRGNDE